MIALSLSSVLVLAPLPSHGFRYGSPLKVSAVSFSEPFRSCGQANGTGEADSFLFQQDNAIEFLPIEGVIGILF